MRSATEETCWFIYILKKYKHIPGDLFGSWFSLLQPGQNQAWVLFLFVLSFSSTLWGGPVLPDSLGIPLDQICWVAPWGQNATAIQGDSSHPWADPWTAAREAPTKSWVVVLPGHWTFGLAGFGAQYEITSGEQANLLHQRNDLSFYFFRDCKLEKIGPFVGGEKPTALFNAQQPGKYRIYGDGTFWWNTEEYRHSICQVDHPEAKLFFQAEELRYGTYGFALYRFQTVRILVQRIRRINYSVSTISLRHRGLQSGCLLDARIVDYYNAPGDSDYSGLFSTRCCGPEVQFENSTIRVRIDRIRKWDPLGSTHAALGGDYGYIMGLVHDARFICSQISLSIGHAEYRQISPGKMQPAIWTRLLPPAYINQAAIQIGSAVLEHSEVHVTVDTLISDFPALSVNFQTADNGTDAPGKIQVNGWFQTLQQVVILEGGRTDANKQIFLSGQASSLWGPWIGDRRDSSSLAAIHFVDWQVRLPQNQVGILAQTPYAKVACGGTPATGDYWFVPPEWSGPEDLRFLFPQKLPMGIGRPPTPPTKRSALFYDHANHKWFLAQPSPEAGVLQWKEID